MGEYIPPKKGIELESNLLFKLSSIYTEISVETNKIFHPIKSLKKRTWSYGTEIVSNFLTGEEVII